jgi:hypothetical protein
MSWITDLFNRNSNEEVYEEVPQETPEAPVEETPQAPAVVQLQILGDDHAWHDVDDQDLEGTYRVVVFDNNFISISDDVEAHYGPEV